MFISSFVNLIGVCFLLSEDKHCVLLQLSLVGRAWHLEYLRK